MSVRALHDVTDGRTTVAQEGRTDPGSPGLKNLEQRCLDDRGDEYALCSLTWHEVAIATVFK